jgi:hypothetical protein
MAYVTSSARIGIDAHTGVRTRFARFFDRLIEARMRQAQRQVDIYLSTLPDEDRRRVDEAMRAAGSRPR